jgi:hypothetical protein
LLLANYRSGTVFLESEVNQVLETIDGTFRGPQGFPLRKSDLPGNLTVGTNLREQHFIVISIFSFAIVFFDFDLLSHCRQDVQSPCRTD